MLQIAFQYLHLSLMCHFLDHQSPSEYFYRQRSDSWNAHLDPVLELYLSFSGCLAFTIH